MRHFVWKQDDFMTMHQFRRKLALALIHNEHLKAPEKTERSKRQRINGNDIENNHELLSAPPHAKKFNGKKWDLSCKAKYQQYTCKMVGCTNKTRTYCNCIVGWWICKSCHPTHVIDEVTADSE
jgi:hypothetical protein